MKAPAYLPTRERSPPGASGRVHGRSSFETLAEDPDRSAHEAAVVVAAYDVSLGSVADVGGGTGALDVEVPRLLR